MPDSDGLQLIRICGRSNYRGALILMTGGFVLYLKMAEEMARTNGLNHGQSIIPCRAGAIPEPLRCSTASRLPSVPALFSYGHIADTDPMPDPETPEWPVVWAAKEVLRRHLGPKFERQLPARLADVIVA